MRGPEILESLDARQTPNHRFVKWWRKEEDFLDYDLIDRFRTESTDSEEIGGIELLTMDEMWHEVQRVAGKRVKLVQVKTGYTVEWAHKGKDGLHTEVCAYTPETLMNIFDVETKGNPLDS